MSEHRAGGHDRRAIGIGLALGLIVVAVPSGVVVRLSQGDSDGRARDQAPAVLTSVTMRRLALSAGVELLSNPSDDGRFVAGTTNDTGDAAILDLTTSEFRALDVGRLDANPEDWFASRTVLSPDGTAIAVNWWGGRGVLRLVRSDGTGLRTLVDTGGDAIPYQWSRDGSMILASLVDREGVNTIALVAAIDGAVRPLRRLAGWVNESPEQMSLSPDGRYVAYDYPEGPTTIDPTSTSSTRTRAINGRLARLQGMTLRRSGRLTDGHSYFSAIAAEPSRRGPWQ